MELLRECIEHACKKYNIYSTHGNMKYVGFPREDTLLEKHGAANQLNYLRRVTCARLFQCTCENCRNLSGYAFAKSVEDFVCDMGIRIFRRSFLIANKVFRHLDRL